MNDNNTQSLPFPVVNDSVRDMYIRIKIGGGFIEFSVPSGGRVVLMKAHGDATVNIGLGGFDDIPPQSGSELHLNDTDA